MKGYLLRLLGQIAAAGIARESHARVLRTLKRCHSVGHGLVYHIPFDIANPEKITIGNFVYFGSNTVINGRGGLNIGDHAVLADQVTILTADHRYEMADSLPFDENYINKPVRIGCAAWIGFGVRIVPGVTIGDGAIIGMGAVVARDIPDGAVAVGNPARAVKFRDKAHYESLVAQEKYVIALRAQKAQERKFP